MKRSHKNALAVPTFWTHSIQGLQDVSSKPWGCQLKGKKQMLWASADFSAVLFGKSPEKRSDPKWALRKLFDHLMPGYFHVLGGRYNIDALLAESSQVLDLAFLSANWRFTRIVEQQMYRKGLAEWPPSDWTPAGWEPSPGAGAAAATGPSEVGGPPPEAVAVAAKPSKASSSHCMSR